MSTTAFGRALKAERHRIGLSRQQFADKLGKSLKALETWEYGYEIASSRLASGFARALGLPAWHFEQALLEDRQHDICRRGEVTMVRVGLASWSVSMSEQEWIEFRRTLLASGSSAA